MIARIHQSRLGAHLAAKRIMLRKRHVWIRNDVLPAGAIRPQPIWIPAPSGGAGVAFDAATSTSDISNLTSKSFSHTCSGTNRYLIVGLAGWDNNTDLSGVTISYNGVSMSKLGGSQPTSNDNAVLWGLVNPASGSNTVAISNIPSAYAELGGGAISFTGVHQTVPTGTLVTSLTATANITLSSGDMGVDVLYAGDARPTAGSGETERIATNGPSASKWMMMGTETGSGTVTMNWSGSADAAIAAIPLKTA